MAGFVIQNIHSHSNIAESLSLPSYAHFFSHSLILPSLHPLWTPATQAREAFKKEILRDKGYPSSFVLSTDVASVLFFILIIFSLFL